MRRALSKVRVYSGGRVARGLQEFEGLQRRLTQRMTMTICQALVLR